MEIKYVVIGKGKNREKFDMSEVEGDVLPEPARPFAGGRIVYPNEWKLPDSEERLNICEILTLHLCLHLKDVGQDSFKREDIEAARTVLANDRRLPVFMKRNAEMIEFRALADAPATLCRKGFLHRIAQGVYRLTDIEIGIQTLNRARESVQSRLAMLGHPTQFAPFVYKS